LKSNTIFFSVGEPSGDLHASNLIRCLQQQQPNLKFRGFGGTRMSDAGCSLDFDLTNLAVVGFTEVLPKLREFFRVADIATQIFDSERPDAVVLVDFPGFNWHIAKRAKERGIPVTYYLPPQLWAWGGWRIKKMRRTVDHVLCNLPFEPGWYQERGMSVDYVGHPFFDEVANYVPDPRFMVKWSQHDGVQVAVLPGSRTREVNNIWPMQLSIIRELAARYPKARFMVACLKDRHCLWCREQMSREDQKLNINFFVGRTSEIIELADCSLMKSGSVSLEMMARNTPSVVVYHASRMLYTIARRLTNITSMTLPNLIAGKTIMPEFLAVGSTARTIERTIAAMDRLIGDPAERARQRDELQTLNHSVAKPGASHRAATAILNHMGLPSMDVFSGQYSHRQAA
jgi:lipid-A-disaccharide synthase